MSKISRVVRRLTADWVAGLVPEARANEGWPKMNIIQICAFSSRALLMCIDTE